MKKLIIAGLLVAAVATPALAKTTKTYYIEQTKSHHCLVTKKQPSGDKTSYPSYSAAKKAIAGMKECKA